MINLKKCFILLSSALLVMLIILSTNVNAADNQITIINPPTATPTPAPTPVVIATPTLVPATTTATVAPATKTPTPSSKLPQTGIEDYTGLITITVLLAGSSVFAYRKMRNMDKY